ncbi:hypothetical protein [Cereibacter sphaeroides]|uniref:hypothetical protein n=1 Tax=Cereibacter sphaeroides TaxID=1063 RepID=UPI0011C358EF|nr:hypothetical protein [Cereibacter sphaeroides]
MNSLAAALLDRHVPYRVAARALQVAPAVLEPSADADGLIEFRRSLRMAIRHHMLLANATRGRSPTPIKRAHYMRHLPAAKRALADAVARIIERSAARCEAMAIFQAGDEAGLARAVAALRTNPARQHGGRRHG